jgi:hypothetical protein
MSDPAELVCPLTPRLKCLMDSLRSELTDVGVGESSVSVLSVGDYAVMDSSWFTNMGETIIGRAERIARKSSVPEAGSIGKDIGSEKFHSSVVFSGEPLDVRKRQQQKKQKYDLSFDPVLEGKGSSSRSQARVSLDAAAKELYDFMDAAAKERYMRGLKKLPGQMGEALVLRTLTGWGIGTLTGALSALRRLGSWLSTKFGSVYSFVVEPAIVGWFLMDNMVDDDDVGHTSKSLVSGLRFAAKTLKYPIDVSDDAVMALSRGPRKSPKQAPSASVRVAYHFWSVAMNGDYSAPLRAMAGSFLVMCLCGLRSIDAQRSSFDSRVADSGNGWGYFSAVAWDSKSKTAMPWACPLITFGASSAWLECLVLVWGESDFMFPSSPRGAKLANLSEMGKSPASAYCILKYLREILQLPSVSMSEVDSKRLRRHSFRHWIANLIRILRKPMADAFQGGRWKEHNCMPLRYAEETKFLAQIRIIADVCADCEVALSRVGVENWPVFGGWDLLMKDRFGEGDAEGVALTVAPQQGIDLNGDSGDEDSSDDEGGEVYDAFDHGERVSPVKPKSRKSLPPGWREHSYKLSSGRVVKKYFGPNGVRARSMVGAWKSCEPESIQFVDPLGGGCPVVVGQLIDVHWTLDEVWYQARVERVANDGSACATVRYLLDREVCVHDLCDVEWRCSVPDVTDQIRQLAAESAASIASFRATRQRRGH